MWIAIRLIFALAGFVCRFIVRLSRPPRFKQMHGVLFCEEEKRDRSGNVTSYELGVKFPKNINFAITREGQADRFFKSIGISEEFQTGDEEFDQHVYIASDHPLLRAALKKDARAREIILTLLRAGFTRIRSDGRTLYAEAKAAKPVEYARDLQYLADAISRLADQIPGRFRDRFVWRATLVEAVIWSFAGYALVAVFDARTHRSDYHVHTEAIWAHGLVLATVALATLFLGIIALFRRSSRAHRILIESALVLLLSLPALGIQGVSDLNRTLDRNQPVTIEAQVTNRWKKEHRGRRGRRYYTYHMSLNATHSPTEFPPTIEISSKVFRTIREGQTIPIELGRGWLGIYWYKSIAGINVGGVR